MKTNKWLILGMMLSGSLLAQSVTNAPPAAPLETPPPAPAATNTLPPPPAPAPEAAPAATNAPAKPAKKKGSKKKSDKSAKKPSKKKEAAELKTVPLVAGPAVVGASNVNVRGQARLKSEVLTRLTKGDQVTVLEEIINNNSGPDEPSAWAKILLPSSAHVWANAAFIDTDQKVKPRKLNLRSGPGENFSVIGQLKQGDEVKQIGTKENWVQIEPPTNTYGFMAAQYLKQEAAGTTPPEVATTEPAPPAAPVTEPPAVATPPSEPPPMPGAGTNVVETNATATNTTPTTAPAAPEEPPKPRIVEREGLVRGMTSIQAPSHFSLINADNHRLMDYLYTTSHELDLRQYKGLHIIVSGEESLDERWPDTPVLTIQKIQVVD